MAEYGLASGLAVKIPYDQMIEQEQRNNVMRQQKQIMAEQKAKMFADDTDYQNVMNEFDNPRIKQVMLEKASKLGSFMRENPGWETNPQARQIYNQIKHGFKDDPELNRGLQSQGNFDMFTKWATDPKNADLANGPEGQEIKRQWDNYRQFGNQHGKQAASDNGIQPFMFTPPEDLFDTTKRAQALLKEAQMHGFKSKNEKGFIGGTRQFVTNEDKLNWGGALLNDQVGGKFYKREWNSISPEDQKVKYGGDARKYMAEKYNIFFPEDKYNPGQQPINRFDPADRVNKTPARNLFLEHLENAYNNAGVPVQGNADGASNMFGDNNGNYNFSNAVIRNSSGNMTPINAGTIRKEKASLSNSKTIFVPDGKDPKKGKFYTSATIQMPVDQYNQNVWEGKNAVDDGTRWYLPTSMEDNPTINSEVVNKRYQDTDFKIVKDDKGQNMVEFEVWNPTDNNTSNADAYNFGAGGLKEKFTSNDGGGQSQSSQVFKDEAGNLFTQDASGNYLPYNK